MLTAYTQPHHFCFDLESLLLYVSIALTNPHTLTPLLAHLLSRYSGRDQEHRQHWSRKVGGALRTLEVLEIENVKLSRRTVLGHLGFYRESPAPTGSAVVIWVGLPDLKDSNNELHRHVT